MYVVSTTLESYLLNKPSYRFFYVRHIVRTEILSCLATNPNGVAMSKYYSHRFQPVVDEMRVKLRMP